MSYSERYRTPGALFPTPSPTSLERLIATWEELRRLDLAGYSTSSAKPMSTWLVQINWADGRISPRSPGKGTTCSPFTTQSVAMAYSDAADSPYAPKLVTGEALPLLFCLAANGNLKPAYQKMMERYGMTQADNEWPRPVIFFNLGYAVEPTELRRGDAVHIDWASGGGHAVFVWDVHLNDKGEVDAFQYVSSNGRIRVGDTRDGAGLGVSVGGTPSGDSGFIRQTTAAPPRYQVLRSPLFTDDLRYVREGVWVTWKSPSELTLKDLTGCRTRPRGKLSYARVVKAARFHGVVPPPPFAMGPPEAPEPDGSDGSDEPSATRRSEATRTLQQRLKLLYEIGWIASDPGAADGLTGPRTRAAVRAFQTAYSLSADGIAGPRTGAALDEVYAAALLSPAGKQYLATGRGVRGAGPSGPLSFGDEPEEVEAFYCRHGVVRAGEPLALLLRLTTADRDGEALSLELHEVTTGLARPLELRLCPDRQRAAARLPAPAVTVPTLFTAVIPELSAVTPPFWVLPAAHSG